MQVRGILRDLLPKWIGFWIRLVTHPLLHSLDPPHVAVSPGGVRRRIGCGDQIRGDDVWVVGLVLS